MGGKFQGNFIGVVGVNLEKSLECKKKKSPMKGHLCFVQLLALALLSTHIVSVLSALYFRNTCPELIGRQSFCHIGLPEAFRVFVKSYTQNQ